MVTRVVLFAILMTLVGAIGGVLILAMFRPRAFRYERHALIAAPASEILPHLVDFRRWADWSPWEKLDPQMKRTFEGDTVYSWDGNKKAGAGRMEILDVSADKVTIKLDFIRPFAASNDMHFLLEPSSAGTHVTWRMTGRNGYMSKLAGMFINFDKLVGKDFEAGLASLAARVTARAPA